MSQTEKPKSKIVINKVYTRSGDKGMTSLVGGQRIPKSHPRIEAYGTVDELNCHVGRAIESSKLEKIDKSFREILIRIQHELFNLGSLLATLPEDLHPAQARIEPAHIELLEEEMDIFNANLPILRSFILPGGSPLAADLHVCRTVCRRAERLLQSLAETEELDSTAIRYLNRLSDAFFVFSRWVLVQEHREENLWNPAHCQPMAPELRVFKPEDLTSVKSLIEKALAPYDLELDPHGTDSDLSDIEKSYMRPGGVFKVLVRQSLLLGMYGLHKEDESTCELRKMYLEPGLKGKGLGKLLLEDAIETAKIMGFKKIILETNRKLAEARRLYEKYGFKTRSGGSLSKRCDLAMEIDL